MRVGKLIPGCLVLIAIFSASVAWGQDDEAKFLKDSVGKWNAEIKMWAGPDQEPMTSKGSETNEMLGENWLVSNFEGDFGGAEFKGVGIIGFDSENKKLVNHWIDSMTPVMAKFEGPYDAKTKTVTMTGEMEGQQGKHVTVIKDAKTRVFTMYSKATDAKDFTKVMEITYTKAEGTAK